MMRHPETQEDPGEKEDRDQLRRHAELCQKNPGQSEMLPADGRNSTRAGHARAEVGAIE